MSGASTLKKDGGDVRRSHSNSHLELVSNPTQHGILEHGLVSASIVIQEEELAISIRNDVSNSLRSSGLTGIETPSHLVPRIGLIAQFLAEESIATVIMMLLEVFLNC